MFLIGLACVLICLWLAIVILDGSIWIFIDIVALIGVMLPVLGVVVATGSFKVLYQGFRAVILPKAEIAEEARGRAASLFRLLSKTAIFSAALVTLIGVINVLNRLDFSDPFAINSIGPNISAALLSLIYGLILVMAVFEPAVFVLKKRGPGKR